MLRCFVQHDIGTDFFFLAALRLFKDGVFGRCKHAVKSTQHGEGKNYLSVLRLPEVATQKISDGPDKGGEVGVGHGVSR